MSTLYLKDERTGVRWEVWPETQTMPPGSVREGGKYLFELEQEDQASRVELLIDEEVLEALRAPDPTTARWRWTPGFHAGTVEARLRIPGRSSVAFEFITDPDVRKLTRDRFSAMVSEVMEDSLALLSLSAFRTGVRHGSGERPPPVARLEFLRSRVDKIEQTVRAIACNPRQRMDAEVVCLPYHRVRAITGKEIARSLRHGRLIREAQTPSGSVLPETLNGVFPAMLETRRKFSSTDTIENRQIAACLRSWADWLGQAAETLHSSASKLSDLRPEHTRWARRCRRLAERLAALHSLSVFAELPSARPELQLTSLFRRDHHYRAFYRHWQDFNRGIAGLYGAFLDVPLARTFKLYELWCYLRLVRAAVLICGTDNVEVEKLFNHDAAGGLTIAAGAASVTIAGRLKICFQRSYQEYWREPGGHGSFTREMTPDIVVTANGSAGQSGACMIVLDAKYRVEEALNDAIASIHMYRDALVEEKASDGISGVVDAAYVLTPYAPASLPDQYRGTEVPARFFHPRYRSSFRFGALTLVPGTPLAEIGQALRTVIGDATGQQEWQMS